MVLSTFICKCVIIVQLESLTAVLVFLPILLRGHVHRFSEKAVEKRRVGISDKAGDFRDGFIGLFQHFARLFHAHVLQILPEGHARVFREDNADI